jgi:hypothetical protein
LSRPQLCIQQITITRKRNEINTSKAKGTRAHHCVGFFSSNTRRNGEKARNARKLPCSKPSSRRQLEVVGKSFARKVLFLFRCRYPSPLAASLEERKFCVLDNVLEKREDQISLRERERREKSFFCDRQHRLTSLTKPEGCHAFHIIRNLRFLILSRSALEPCRVAK